MLVRGTPKLNTVLRKTAQKLYTLLLLNASKGHTLGTAAWNTKSVIGNGCEFVAVIEIETMLLGLPASFSNSNCTNRPFFANAVIGGMPAKETAVSGAYQEQRVLLAHKSSQIIC